jgi:ubiquinone/menaquinone biosynthesis C-methylase UbiE
MTQATDARGGPDGAHPSDRAAYDEIAEWYDTWIGTHAMGDDPFFWAVAELMGDVAGRDVLDLACGQGRVARPLAALGAHIPAVDVSRRLLAIAERHEAAAPCGITYRHSDARSLTGIPDAAFDGVLCNLALMDIADLTPTLSSVARVLRPGGWFVFSILHPCYHTGLSYEVRTEDGAMRAVGRYFTEGHWRSDRRPGPPGKVGAYHRTLSTYVNELTAAGLPVEALREPGRPTGPVPNSPAFAGLGQPSWAEVPSVLAVRCRKWGCEPGETPGG